MKDVLNSAVHEIRELRRRNEILSAQMGVVEVFAAALGLKHGEGGMGPDVAWQLEREIERIISEEKRNAAMQPESSKFSKINEIDEYLREGENPQ